MRAAGLIATSLERFGWTEGELSRRPKAHPAKVERALQLRSWTILSRVWVAERLSMGSRGYLAWSLLQKRKRKALAGPQASAQALLSI